MKQDKISGLLGIAKKSGNVKSGEFAVEQAVKSGEAKLVIVSSDASDNTKKLFNDKCAYYEIPIIEALDKNSLGRALGTDVRSSAAVTDEGLAKAILEKI